MSKDLKTCPFCGGGKSYVYTSMGGDSIEDTHCVVCEDCNAETAYFDTKAEAITAWNTRTPDNADLLEGLKEAVYIVKQVNTIISTPDRYPTLSWRKLIKQAEGE